MNPIDHPHGGGEGRTEVVIRQHHGGFQLRDIKLGRIQDQMILLLEEGEKEVIMPRSLKKDPL